jgi:ferredoxin
MLQTRHGGTNTAVLQTLEPGTFRMDTRSRVESSFITVGVPSLRFFVESRPGKRSQHVSSYCQNNKVCLRPRRHNLLLSWTPAGSVQKVQVTVYEKGKSEPRVLEAPVGSNLRKVLLENKIDVYTLRGKLTNCGGGGQCGTCIVDITEGQYNTNPRGWREARIFENKQAPDSWRLSCCTKIEGPITVHTKPQ